MWARRAIIAAPRDLYAYQIDPSWLLHDGNEPDSPYKVIRSMLECDPLHARVAVVMPPEHVLDGHHLELPSDRVIIEISGEVSDDLRRATSLATEHGYAMAIQASAHAEPDASSRPVYVWCDAGDARRSGGELLERAGLSGSRLLARNVQTAEDADLIVKNGFDLIQGSCFDLPHDSPPKEISVISGNAFRFLAELSKPDADHDVAAAVVATDPALTFRLLRYINSSALGVRHQICSVRRAVAMLGEAEFRRWAFASALGDICKDKPTELVRRAVVRGRFAELASAHLGIAAQAGEAGMIGTLSTIDAILDQPMKEVLGMLPISTQAKDVLLGSRSVPLARPMLVAELCESGAWSSLSRCCAEMKVLQREILLVYYAALTQTANLQQSI